MAKQTIAYLKGKFETGDTPTQQDFYDLLESYLHLDANKKRGYCETFIIPAAYASSTVQSNELKIATAAAVFIADDKNADGGTWYHADIASNQDKGDGTLNVGSYNGGNLNEDQLVIIQGTYD